MFLDVFSCVFVYVLWAFRVFLFFVCRLSGFSCVFCVVCVSFFVFLCVYYACLCVCLCASCV